MPTPREAYTNSVRADPIGGERLRAADYGAAGEMLGRAAQGFGQDLGRVAKDVEEIEIRDAEVAAQEADNIRVAKRLKVLYGDPESGETGYFNTEGRNAVTSQAALADRLRKVDEEAAAVLKGKPRALKMFEQVTIKRNQDEMPRVAQHAAKQREVWEKQVDNDAFDLAIDNAASSLDPAIVEQNIATAGNLAVKQVLRTGNYDPNSIAQARQAGVGKAVAAVAERMSIDSPAEAQAFVMVKAVDMDPQDAGKLLEQLAAPAAKERAGQQIGSFLVTTSTAQQAVATPAAPAGLVAQGNINLNNRPVVNNRDGTISTVRTISIGTDDGEVLIPTVVDGKVVSEKEAIAHYRKTGEHLGVFKSAAEATAYAKQLHNSQAQQYARTPTPAFDALHAALLGVETPGGAHTDASGRLITSRAGARGAGQIMPASGGDPGYGVKPLQNSSREEHIRFSRDLLKAYTKEFGGNTVLGLVAYNWGPGNLKAHIRKVGDPSKGQISDAAFINSIPVKEAREYAPKILSRVGVSAGGATAAPADPAVQSPTYQGEEINLAATYARIDAADLTFADKEALKGEARERYSLGKQARSDAEDRLKDAAWTEINRLGDNFTDYSKLPLTIRQQLASNPTLEAQFRSQAESNQRVIQAAADARAAETERRRAEEAELNALELFEANPDEFLKRDWRTMPGLDFGTRKAMMTRAQSLREKRENPNSLSPDHEKIRTYVRRYSGGPASAISKERGNTDLLPRAFDKAIVLEQQFIDQNKRMPTDGERDAIARSVMMPVVIQKKGTIWGTTDEIVPRFVAPERARQLGSRYAGGKVNQREMIRTELQRLRGGRIPSEAEVDAIIAERNSGR